MALTKTETDHLTAQTSTTATPTAVDVSNAYRATVLIEIVQVGTATTAASISVEVSTDNSDFYELTSFTAGTAADTYEWVVDIPDAVQYVRTPYTAQSGGTSSTCDVTVAEITGI